MLTDPIRRFGDFLVSLGLVTEGQVQEALALQPLTGNRVGEALLSLGYLTRGQLQRALSMAVQSGNPVVLDRPPLGEILVGLRYADDSQVEAGLASQQKTGQRLGETLVSQGVIDHQQLYEALGLQQRMATPLPEPERLSTTELRSASGKRVVFIDDSEIALALIGEALTAQGYEVTTFSDPFLALEQLDVLKPDLVITDLDMPGLDGGEVCRRLKAGPSSALPVIILSAHDAELLKVKGLRDGADDYVSKSVSMHELGARVESVLRRTRETDRVRRLFARYTSDAVVEEILRGGGEVVLTGERREVTVLFADLRDFTAFAEARPPEDVMRFLNEVLGRLADVVLARGGTLDKFLGDGLMAVWGAPVRRDDDLLQAVDAARAMHAALDAFNAGRDEPFQLGIGVNTGPVLAGSLGNARRTDYTCIGDTVNVASRLCALAGPGETLLGEGTAQGLPGRAESLPPVKLKGKAHEVPLFRLVR